MLPAEQPLFSVIIPTRNRSSLFAVALQSVIEQRFRDFEVIVVNDGSSAEHEARYHKLVGSAQRALRMLTLVHTELGHGQSYALNYGAAQARGNYLCFLDDDDQWIDPDFLGRAADVVATSQEQVELLLANQRGFQNGVVIHRAIWIEDLEERLTGVPDTAGAYIVTPSDLLS